MSVDYRAWLDGARAQLEELQRQKDQLKEQQAELLRQDKEIDRQISGMAQTVSGLASLVPDPPPDCSLMSILGLIGKTIVEIGLTARIRTILQAADPQDLSAIEIRSELETTGLYLGDYANALSAIYTTLRRLVEAGELDEIQSPSGKRFRWKHRTAAEDPRLLLSAAGTESRLAPTKRRRRIASLATRSSTPTLLSTE